VRHVPVALVAVAMAVVTSGSVFVRTHDSKVRGNTQYTIGTVAKATVKRTVSATGTLEAWTTVDVKSKAGRTIDLLAVDVGSTVKAGQIIAKIDPADSLLTYNQAKAGAESAEAKQAQSADTLRIVRFKDGRIVSGELVEHPLDASELLSEPAQLFARGR